jgi:hypothetical protein
VTYCNGGNGQGYTFDLYACQQSSAVYLRADAAVAGHNGFAPWFPVLCAAAACRLNHCTVFVVWTTCRTGTTDGDVLGILPTHRVSQLGLILSFQPGP